MVRNVLNAMEMGKVLSQLLNRIFNVGHVHTFQWSDASNFIKYIH